MFLYRVSTKTNSFQIKFPQKSSHTNHSCVIQKEQEELYQCTSQQTIDFIQRFSENIKEYYFACNLLLQRFIRHWIVACKKQNIHKERRIQILNWFSVLGLRWKLQKLRCFTGESIHKRLFYQEIFVSYVIVHLIILNNTRNLVRKFWHYLLKKILKKNTIKNMLKKWLIT